MAGPAVADPSVDAETGEAVIWDRHDGALRAGTNLDLAGDARVVIVAEPMAHAYDTSSTAAGAQEVVRLVPDADAIKVLGPDLTAWVPAYQAGLRQAPSAAKRIRACSAVMCRATAVGMTGHRRRHIRDAK